MDKLLIQLLTNNSNGPVLQFLNIDSKKDQLFFKKWEDVKSPLNEGGCSFFDEHGKYVPRTCKYALEVHHIMINPESGGIFAFHTGRYSMFFRCDFKKSGLINMDHYRKGFTFDCIADITSLGENWCFLEHTDFEGEEPIQLKWAYEKTTNKCIN